ncbi:hypothetical protein WDW86_13475 [Bdellovibrionota bacterium FG-2]
MKSLILTVVICLMTLSANLSFGALQADGGQEGNKGTHRSISGEASRETAGGEGNKASR